MSPVKRVISEGATPAEYADTLGKSNAKRFEFSTAGEVQVKVKVKSDKIARAKALPENDPPSGGGFVLDRLVINLMVPGGADSLELSVKAQAGETKLAYFYNNAWNLLRSKKEGGFLVAQVENFPDDPAIGIGH